MFVFLDGGGGGRAVADPCSVEKPSTALQLDGLQENESANLEYDDFVKLPRSGALDFLQTKSYTIASWYKPAAVPTGSGSDNGRFHGIVIKPGMHIGLFYDELQRLRFAHAYTDASNAPVFAQIIDPRSHPVDEFRHIAGVVNHNPVTGKSWLRFYVDGVPVAIDGKQQIEFSGIDHALSRFESRHWRIGIAAPAQHEWRWPAKGVIDDVAFF